MLSIILDTNVLSELMRTEPDQAVMDWFAIAADRIYFTSVINKAEILLGIALLPAGKRRDALAMAAETMFNEDFTDRVLSLDEKCAAGYAAIVSGRRRAGLQMTTEDAQIASIALAHGFALATRNTKDFLHIDGLQLLNPWQSK